MSVLSISANAAFTCRWRASKGCPANADAHMKMPAPVARTGVAGVQMALVFDFQRQWREIAHQDFAHAGDAITHGNTLRNGRTSTLA